MTDSISREWLEAILAFGAEQRGIEFKGPGALSDKAFLAKVIRAIIGIANKRDGGIVFVGILEDEDGAPQVVGLSSEQLSTWKHDDLGDKLAVYTDPSVGYRLEKYQHEGADVVLVHVAEFTEIPIICKRPYGQTLQEGALYVRNFRKPETTAHYSHADLRELIELATEKSFRKLLDRSERAGISRLSSDFRDLYEADLSTFDGPPAVESDDDGHWSVVIKPAPYDADRISEYSRLPELIRSHAVNYRGMMFPGFREGDIQRELNYIQSEVRWRFGGRDRWRFYQSGLLVFAGCLMSDFLDKRQAGSVLNLGELVGRYSEIFELSARLYGAIDNVESVSITIELHRLRGRMLWLRETAERWVPWHLMNEQASIDHWSRERTYDLVDLQTNSKRLAIDEVMVLAERFASQIERPLYESLQAEIVNA